MFIAQFNRFCQCVVRFLEVRAEAENSAVDTGLGFAVKERPVVVPLESEPPVDAVDHFASLLAGGVEAEVLQEADARTPRTAGRDPGSLPARDRFPRQHSQPGLTTTSALVLLLPGPVSFGWGHEGHTVVGLVAEHYMTGAGQKSGARIGVR